VLWDSDEDAPAALVHAPTGLKVTMTSTIERSAEIYGLIGVTFVFVTWLFVSALVIIAAGVIGAEASDRPPRLRSVKP
jgi:uncharacterized BrkB/YihY/UPF0761 family membrane protein